MKFAQPNAKQKAWRESVRNLGCVVTHCHPTQIHHPAGRTARQNKIPIGHAFVLPVMADVHALIHKNATYDLKTQWLNYNYERARNDIESMTLHEFEKFLFGEVCKKLKFPFGEDVYNAIMEWHR